MISETKERDLGNCKIYIFNPFCASKQKAEKALNITVRNAMFFRNVITIGLKSWSSMTLKCMKRISVESNHQHSNCS